MADRTVRVYERDDDNERVLILEAPIPESVSDDERPLYERAFVDGLCEGWQQGVYARWAAQDGEATEG